MADNRMRWISGLVLGTALIVSLLVNIFTFTNSKKTGFVNNAELFEGFKGKRELQTKLEQEDNSRKGVLDSVSLELTLLVNELQGKPQDKGLLEIYNRKKAFADRLQQEYDYIHKSRNAEYTEQIWKQINQYISEFGDNEGYDYIYGAVGNGSLMYGSKSEDITDEALEYINKKYDGF